jgi:hypothetical protein
MTYTPLGMKFNEDSSMLRTESFLGVDYSVSSTQIHQLRSPDMMNCHINDDVPDKRTGYERIFTTSLGVGKINGLAKYRKKDGTLYRLAAHGTKLYTWQKGVQPIEIYNGLANSKVRFFVFNDKCYIMDGTNYLVYDGTTVSAVPPYIPTILISKSPASGSADYGGTASEDWNLLGSGFKESFSGDGTTTLYQLSQTDLDATTVTIVVDNVEKVEGTDFTVNRTNGTITFSSAPPTGTNNVIITAYKTYSGFMDRIKKCLFSVIFGGSNDTRVFISGNPDYPEFVRRSGLNDPSYWPENGQYKFSDTVKGFAKQYDYLVVERERGKHQVSFHLNNGVASFPSKPINDQVGTLASDSLQIIENNPVSLSKDGVYMLVASNVRDERNVVHISNEVDEKLMKETNLDQAISIEHDQKYWLAVNGNVYVLDYTKKRVNPYGEWIPYDNIPANCFLELEGELYFGSSTDGLIYRFKGKDEADAFNDDGQPITAYWSSKVFSFGADDQRKLVEKAFFSLRPSIRTSADLYVTTDRKARAKVNTTRMDLIDYAYFDYSKWSYSTNTFPQETRTKVKAKKIVYFQMELRNDKLDEGMGILSTALKYEYSGEVK